MENIVLAIHLILAVILISIVLVQNSDGGLGSMGGSSGTNLTSTRAASTALTKLTWIIAILFFITSITLTLMSVNNTKEKSLIKDENTVNEIELDFPLPNTDLIDIENDNVSPAIPPPLE